MLNHKTLVQADNCPSLYRINEMTNLKTRQRHRCERLGATERSAEQKRAWSIGKAP